MDKLPKFSIKKVKKIAIKRDIFIKIGLILLSLFLLFLFIWLGFSFYSMQGGNEYLIPIINLEEELDRKVAYESLNREGNYLEYRYKIVTYQIAFEEDKYVLYAYAYDFLDSYEDIEDAKFVYELDKDKGKFDFETLEWGQPFYITLRYRVDKDFNYFIDYSVSLLKKFISGELSMDSKGEFTIKRDMNNWEIEVLEPVILE